MYLWLKAGHLIAMVCWFAGLFYLPRLFVYHAMAEDTASQERFVVMERKLYRGIMTPAMALTVIFGIALLALNIEAYKAAVWMHIKLAIIVCLIGYHHVCKAYLRAFAQGRNRKSHVFFRWFNEVPVVALIVVVTLAVVKPF